jgi:hypothetical protein
MLRESAILRGFPKCILRLIVQNRLGRLPPASPAPMRVYLDPLA